MEERQKIVLFFKFPLQLFSLADNFTFESSPRKSTVATQTEVTVSPDSVGGGGGRNKIMTNVSAFREERRDLKRWAQMGSLTF